MEGPRADEFADTMSATLVGANSLLVSRIPRSVLAGGLFVVALARHRTSFGWKVPLRDFLIGLRRHPNTEVRYEAYAVSIT